MPKSQATLLLHASALVLWLSTPPWLFWDCLPSLSDHSTLASAEQSVDDERWLEQSLLQRLAFVLETLGDKHEHSWDSGATVASYSGHHWVVLAAVEHEAALAAVHIAAVAAVAVVACLCQVSADTGDRTVALLLVAFLRSHWKVFEAVVLNSDYHHCNYLDIQATLGLELASYLAHHILGRTVGRIGGRSLGCTVVASTRRIALDTGCHTHFEQVLASAVGRSKLAEGLHRRSWGRMP